jgi:2-polyprenyl-3-methyl-5-hydroxy-6-metoxy-1,4-benzoquinol methylase
MKTIEEVKAFYDQDTLKKYKIRNNLRHYNIIVKLTELGIRKAKNILEIGCGNGGVTRLIAKKTKANIVGIDISETTIAAAKDNLKAFPNIRLEAVDLFDFHTAAKFDFILLLDVLEHIPFEQHDGIIGKIGELLEEGGHVFIHIPEPSYNAWASEHHPETMQVIDLAVHSGDLIAACYKHGLYLTELKSYRAFHEENDYQYIVLTKLPANRTYHKRSKLGIIRDKQTARLKNLLR